MIDDDLIVGLKKRKIHLRMQPNINQLNLKMLILIMRYLVNL